MDLGDKYIYKIMKNQAIFNTKLSKNTNPIILYLIINSYNFIIFNAYNKKLSTKIEHDKIPQTLYLICQI